jgi:hypothetical protein
MKTRIWAGLWVLGLIGSAGCSGTIGGASSGGSTGGGNTGGGNTGGGSGQSTGTTGSSTSSSGQPITCPPPEPKNHRTAEMACGPSMPAKTCATDADCSSPAPQPAGKCVAGTCSWNQCTQDGDCTGNDVCVCQNQSFGWAHMSLGSVCVPANCHTDSDCGPGGFCSPTVSASCGPFYGVQGFYCHTCKDTCIDDSDCGPAWDGGPAGYCAYDPSVGHWACGNSFCAG